MSNFVSKTYLKVFRNSYKENSDLCCYENQTTLVLNLIEWVRGLSLTVLRDIKNRWVHVSLSSLIRQWSPFLSEVMAIYLIQMNDRWVALLPDLAFCKFMNIYLVPHHDELALTTHISRKMDSQSFLLLHQRCCKRSN